MTIDEVIHECEHLSDEFDYENMNGNMAYSTYSDFKDSIGKIQKWLEENSGYQRHEAWNDGYKQGMADEKRNRGEVWFPDCDSAVKTSMGLCNGYCYAENDDEPIDQCKICKKHVSRVDGEVE